MVAIGTHAGAWTEALITDMDAPLGSAIGNTLEIIECVETLKGQGPSEVADVVLHIATRMVLLAGRERDTEVAARSVEDALSSGRALETFRSMIQAHGGNPVSSKTTPSCRRRLTVSCSGHRRLVSWPRFEPKRSDAPAMCWVQVA